MTGRLVVSGEPGQSRAPVEGGDPGEPAASSVVCLAAARVVTCDPARATEADPLGVIEQGAVAVSAGNILATGTEAELRARFPAAQWRTFPRAVMTPGLVDAHTHSAWVGSRDSEYTLRMSGADYEAIAKAGGGIVASMRAIRAADPSDIAAELRARLARMAAMGVTTIEVKSGYGLDHDGELKQLDAIATVTATPASAPEQPPPSLPRVVPTFLGLHALPPEAKGDRDAYARLVTDRLLPIVAERGLARFVDAYVDRSAFSVAQARPFFERALALGLRARVHAGQFADVGGAELCADIAAASANHLENVSPEAIARMAETGVRAVLLPVASFTLKQDPPPIAALRAAGVRMVVASDANPGTAPTESLPLALAFAVRLYGLTVPETLLAATREAAASLALADTTGMLRGGLSADIVVWSLPHENAIVQPWGVPRAQSVWREGVRIAGAP